MSTLYTILVTNNSSETQDFFFFQKPAQYVGGPTIYSNSIFHGRLRPSGGGVSSQIKFQFLQQYYAGVENQAKNLVVGSASGTNTAIAKVDLTGSDPKAKNTVNMLIDPPDFEQPSHTDEVQDGAFRIVTPQFDPTLKKYNAGLGVTLEDGSYSLSNFINVQPLKNIDVQPIVIFYVQTGSYEAGDVINFTISSVGAAVCDATSGNTTFNVTYNLDGSWTVNSVSDFLGLTQLI